MYVYDIMYTSSVMLESQTGIILHIDIRIQNLHHMVIFEKMGGGTPLSVIPLYRWIFHCKPSMSEYPHDYGNPHIC